MNVIDSLLELQTVDGQIRQLEVEEKDLPTRKAKETARLAGVNAALEIAVNQLQAMQKRVKDEEAEAEELRAKAQSVKAAQMSMAGKELEQSIMQVEGLEHEATSAENRALALQEDEIPTLEKRVKDAEQKVAEEKGGVSGTVDDLDQRFALVEAHLVELRAERITKANEIKKLDPQMLLYYERVSTKRWPVLVPLTDGVCEGCHMKQPPFVDQLVQHNVAAIQKNCKVEKACCTMCGRLLYSL